MNSETREMPLAKLTNGHTKQSERTSERARARARVQIHCPPRIHSRRHGTQTDVAGHIWLHAEYFHFCLFIYFDRFGD